MSTAYISEVLPIPGIRGPSVDIGALVEEGKEVTSHCEPDLAHRRVSWKPEGHNTWHWLGNKINYIEMGDPSKPALLLIHGFGVSSFHFRHNLPELSKNYHVYAFDMLGFGCSSMPVQDYEPEVWRDQTIAFVQEVIGRPTAIAGNSLGGLAALYAAASQKLQHLVTGCILMNAALRFKSTEPKHAFVSTKCEEDQANPKLITKMWGSFQRLVLGASFEFTKQPERIEKVLRHVYAVNTANVDGELIESIKHSSLHENAAEVYYRVLSKNGAGTKIFADDLLAQLKCPLMLCWGTKDPWFKTDACEKIQALYKQTLRVDVSAGHCPHDENPDDVNSAIHSFMSASC
ncbi:Pheophytinase, chloroplastic [Seminavis robusta]|uniref:Pheophytinase, chloroplastic n=1 Tax=Seminavis robusta TaxID=568900 RepID=A0A9N8H3P4_9STRA|nr:Pheophytinase, chloroplastic [Seminavis robusta]|eukprot:Sro65_g036970.1 Pheophytinase, chloroplastic (346) ;mRNA; f:124111-125148